jgi:hypothetical protein
MRGFLYLIFAACALAQNTLVVPTLLVSPLWFFYLLMVDATIELALLSDSPWPYAIAEE